MTIERLLDRAAVYRLLTNGPLLGQLPWLRELSAARPQGRAGGGCRCGRSSKSVADENVFIDRVKEAIIAASDADKSAIKAVLRVNRLRITRVGTGTVYV